MATAPAERADPWAQTSLAAKGALALASTFVSLGLFTIGAALPPLEAAFSSVANSALLIQLIGSIAAPAFAVASPIAGVLVMRYGVKTIYLASLALFLVAGAGPALCNSLVPILAFRILLGVAVAGGFAAGMVGIARLPARLRANMLGLSAFLGGGTAIFAYQAVGSLAAESWRLAFLVVLAMAPAAILALFLPGRSRLAGQVSDVAVAPVAPSRVPAVLLIVAVFTGWAMVASSIYSPFYLSALGFTDPARIGSILAVLAFGSLAGSGTYGFFQKRLGTAGVMVGGLAICAAGCAVLALGQGQPFPMIGLGTMGIGLGAAGTAIYALAIELVGEGGDSGKAMGMLSLALYLPQVVFPLAAGLVAGASSPSVVYACMAALLVVSAVLVATRIRRALAAMAAVERV